MKSPKEIVVMSGKGGTGKTFVSASLVYLAASDRDTVVADCDVDASNLHLLLKPNVERTHEYSAGHVASIDLGICTSCGVCASRCRFDAITMTPRGAVVDPVACEGCGVCRVVCPVAAVSMHRSDSGRWYESTSDFGPMIHAHLFAGEENSGKLVEQVRRRAAEAAREAAARRVLVDGPPGTGCAAKSAMTGADLVVIVTEPTPAGIHDMRRILALAKHFSIPASLVINKSTLSEEKTAELVSYAKSSNLPLLGTIPFDRQVVESVVAMQPFPHYARVHRKPSPHGGRGGADSAPQNGLTDAVPTTDARAEMPPPQGVQDRADEIVGALQEIWRRTLALVG